MIGTTAPNTSVPVVHNQSTLGKLKVLTKSTLGLSIILLSGKENFIIYEPPRCNKTVSCLCFT